VTSYLCYKNYTKEQGFCEPCFLLFIFFLICNKGKEKVGTLPIQLVDKPRRQAGLYVIYHA
jgi:hypothetical protein